MIIPIQLQNPWNSLFVFIDESGNFDFSNLGTAHFVMASVMATLPLESASRLNALKYELLTEGVDVSDFHASEDKQSIRDRVFPIIDSLEGVRVHVIFGDKHFLPPNLQSPEGLYGLFGKAIVKFAFRSYSVDSFSQVVIVFDQALSKKKQGAFMAAVKPELKAIRKPFRIYFHQMKTDANGQIADYICWAKFVELERNEMRPWSAITTRLRPTSFNIFHNGHTQYY
jgi:hypothetical protein